MTATDNQTDQTPLAGQYLADQRSLARLAHARLRDELKTEVSRVRVILREGDEYIRQTIEGQRDEVDWIGMCFTYEQALERLVDVVSPVTEKVLRTLVRLLDALDRTDEEQTDQETHES